MPILNRFAKYALLIALLMQGSGPAWSQIGGDEDLPLYQERQIGDQIAREIFRDPDNLDDPLLVDYVQSLWQPLLKAARLRGDLTPDLDERYNWQLFVARDPTFNAFATFGGVLAIHSGLIERTTQRSQVAAVLAHELAHVTQRHLSRQMGKESRKQPLVLAAMILGAAFIGRSPELANAAIVGGQAASLQNQINYTRDMEREADRIGYEIYTTAQFSPASMVGMFEVMERASRFNDFGNFPYLRTHPLNSERIADISNRVAQTAAMPATLEVDSVAEMMAMRARLLSGKSTDVLTQAAAHPKSDLFASQSLAMRRVALYGAALANHLLKNHAAAMGHLTALEALSLPPRQTDPEVQQLIGLLGLEIESGPDSASGPQPARGRLEAFQARWSRQPVEHWPRSSALLPSLLQLKTGAPNAVTESMALWLVDHPKDAQAWRMLARAQDKLGERAQAIRSMAEAQSAELDHAGAIERIRSAQRIAIETNLGDHEQSILQSRLRAFIELRKRQLDDNKATKS
jgi:predicted Zn-dependent protease